MDIQSVSILSKRKADSGNLKARTPSKPKDHWSPSEDQLLRGVLVEKEDGTLKVDKWSRVADEVPGRSARRCRERWLFNLNSTLKHGPWTIEEDIVLVKGQCLFENRWANQATFLPGRTENSVKTRHKALQRAWRREWKPHEDSFILGWCFNIQSFSSPSSL